MSSGGAGTQVMTIEASGDSTPCRQYALHTTGSNWTSSAGIGLTNLAGTSSSPLVYPNSKNYRGIRFRAKLGSGHPANSPVRFNVSTPWTEATGQHLGRYLQDDYALTTEWKDITFCFDRDLYPLTLPSALTNAQRESVAANMLKLEFQFNQGKDWTVTTYPADGKYTTIAKTTPFDLD